MATGKAYGLSKKPAGQFQKILPSIGTCLT